MTRSIRRTVGLGAIGALMMALLGVAAAAPTYAGKSAPPSYTSYVALGDSYTAAPFVPVTSPDGGCYRSNHNYPSLVAADLGVASFQDVSCSGAQTEDFTSSQYPGVAPQFAALSDQTQLVTVGMGGNDFSVFGTLVGYCTTLRASDPTGDPCREHFTNPSGGNTLFTDILQTRARLVTALQQIATLAPNARIVVVGYPEIVPTSGTCPSLLPLADGDYAYGRQLNHQLDLALKYAAQSVRATYVDVWKASRGHSICSADPWINGQYTDPTRALAFHPFAVEQQAVAGLVEQAVTR